ncbi:MAG: GGDEF domain-containing protein [Fibrobacter sp.]|nr:GGDEF domain-containing protein [Fibrobacter sp.]
MNWFAYFIWFVLFIAGVCFTYYTPQATLSLSQKFLYISIWGAALGVILTAVLSRKGKTEPSGEQTTSETTPQEDPETAKNSGTPESQTDTSSEKKEFLAHLESWSQFCEAIAKARPFPEIVGGLRSLLSEIYPESSGALYMYNGNLMEQIQIFAFGNHSVGSERIHSEECLSFDRGEISMNDFSNLTIFCTHLHRHTEGYSLCAPVEGMEEHFGTLVLYFPEMQPKETLREQKTALKIIAATFGVYAANQKLNILFETHSIRDPLTSLFNRRYMEESLAREVFAAVRHDIPIGMIMFRPDSYNAIRETHGLRTAEQLLWEIGQRVPHYIRGEDIPCRFDANTFCIILPGANPEITLTRAEKIRYEIGNLEISYGNVLLSSTLSLGTANIPKSASNGEQLIHNSLALLSEAELTGNCVKTPENS